MAPPGARRPPPAPPRWAARAGGAPPPAFVAHDRTLARPSSIAHWQLRDLVACPEVEGELYLVRHCATLRYDVASGKVRMLGRWEGGRGREGRGAGAGCGACARATQGAGVRALSPAVKRRPGQWGGRWFLHPSPRIGYPILSLARGGAACPSVGPWLPRGRARAPAGSGRVNLSQQKKPCASRRPVSWRGRPLCGRAGLPRGWSQCTCMSWEGA
jgi:hypothetical protein